jgi:hypothetical protein
MTRRNLTNCVFTGLLTTIFCVSIQNLAEAQSRKGAKPGNGYDEGNRDGKNTVAGAIWQLTATKAGSKDEVTFRYRVADLKIYDIKTGKKIGVASLNNGKDDRGGGEVTFYKNSPFPSKFRIKHLRLSHWKGGFDDGKTKWAIKLDCLDR